jgi:flagellar assembly protein FliH
MILLSRLIKSQVAYPAHAEKKLISIKKFQVCEIQENEQTEIIQPSHDFIEEAKLEAEQIIQAAKKEQESIYADLKQEKLNWEQEKVNLMNEAKNEGYQSGWKEGESQGYAQYHSYITDAQKVITAAKNDYHSYLESSEKTILELALKIASKIVATKIEDDQKYFLSLVKKAVKEVKNFSETQIHVHPTQYEFLLSKKDDLLSIFTHDTNLVIYPDSDLREGNCIIESPSGRIDAGIDTQLTEIKNALIECLEGAS